MTRSATVVVVLACASRAAAWSGVVNSVLPLGLTRGRRLKLLAEPEPWKVWAGDTAASDEVCDMMQTAEAEMLAKAGRRPAREPTARPLREPPSRSLAIGDISVKLVVCTNTNICGRANPTWTYGYGFAFKAIECLRALGPPGLEVKAGPCFIRCSRGVNARLTGKSDAAGKQAVRSRDLYRLNNVDLVVGMLEEELSYTPPAEAVRAYHCYNWATIVLDEAAAGGPSSEARANEAMPLLDEAARFALRSSAESDEARGPSAAAEQGARPSARRARPSRREPRPDLGARTPLARGQAGANAAAVRAARQRASWAGSRWRESWHGTELSFGGGGGGMVNGSYGTPRTAGRHAPPTRPFTIVGSQVGPELQGSVEDADGAAGEATLTMSADALEFAGCATLDGEVYEWRGVRLAEPDLAAPGNPGELGLSTRGAPRERWHATVLALRSSCLVTLGRGGEALEDAAHAARICASLPEAWEAMASAALAASDRRTAAMALGELLHLQPASTKRLPQVVQNRRREQAFDLARIRGTYAFGTASNPMLASAVDGFERFASDNELGFFGEEPAAEAEAEVEAEEAEPASADEKFRRIFAEGYAVPPLDAR